VFFSSKSLYVEGVGQKYGPCTAVVSKISLGHLQPVLLSFLKSAFNIVSLYIPVEISEQPYKFIIIFNFCNILATDPEVPGSIPGATKFSEK
jgi:hypothetical protein